MTGNLLPPDFLHVWFLDSQWIKWELCNEPRLVPPESVYIVFWRGGYLYSSESLWCRKLHEKKQICEEQHANNAIWKLILPGYVWERWPSKQVVFQSSLWVGWLYSREGSPPPKPPTPLKRVCANTFRSCLCKISSLFLYIQQEACRKSLDKLFAQTVLTRVYSGGCLFGGGFLSPLKTPNSSNQESRPFFLGDNSFWSLPLFSPLATIAFGGPEGYFSLAIIAFGAFEFIVPKDYHGLGKTEKRSLDSLV